MASNNSIDLGWRADRDPPHCKHQTLGHCARCVATLKAKLERVQAENERLKANVGRLTLKTSQIACHFYKWVGDDSEDGLKIFCALMSQELCGEPKEGIYLQGAELEAVRGCVALAEEYCQGVGGAEIVIGRAYKALSLSAPECGEQPGHPTTGNGQNGAESTGIEQNSEESTGSECGVQGKKGCDGTRKRDPLSPSWAHDSGCPGCDDCKQDSAEVGCGTCAPYGGKGYIIHSRFEYDPATNTQRDMGEMHEPCPSCHETKGG